MIYSQIEKDAIYRVIAERRDMRHFKSDPIENDVLQRLLQVAQQAPSVGYMQPWRFIRITHKKLRDQIYQLVQEEIQITGQEMESRKEEYMKLKLEGINECAELWVAALMEGREKYILGRRTIPEMDLASLSCAVQNIWLAARSEGIGVGWVSFFKPNEIAGLLEMPNNSYPAAILCMGYVEEFYLRPLLETAGWDIKRKMEEIFFENFWGNPGNLL